MSQHFLHSLEDRTLFSTPNVTLAGATLNIQGTKDADVIVVGYAADGKNVFVMTNNASGTTTQTFPAAKLKKAIIDGKGGDDVIVIDESFRAFVPTQVSGGAGSDVLIGGSGKDTITGGAGDDIIFGNGGSDKLSGKKGDDMLFGGDGDDTIRADKGTNFIAGDDGTDKIRSKSSTDVIVGAALDLVKTGKGGATFVP
jgi:Ca2+-binding RTX toxin-like protein